MTSTSCSWLHIVEDVPAFFRSKKTTPVWLDQAQEFCGSNGITITAWGPHALVVEAKSPEVSAEIARQLANLGFVAMKDEDDANAGLLTLSHPE